MSVARARTGHLWERRTSVNYVFYVFTIPKPMLHAYEMCNSRYTTPSIPVMIFHIRDDWCIIGFMSEYSRLYAYDVCYSYLLSNRGQPLVDSVVEYGYITSFSRRGIKQDFVSWQVTFWKFTMMCDMFDTEAPRSLWCNVDSNTNMLLVWSK